MTDTDLKGQGIGGVRVKAKDEGCGWEKGREILKTRVDDQNISPWAIRACTHLTSEVSVHPPDIADYSRTASGKGRSIPRDARAVGRPQGYQNNNVFPVHVWLGPCQTTSPCFSGNIDITQSEYLDFRALDTLSAIIRDVSVSRHSTPDWTKEIRPKISLGSTNTPKLYQWYSSVLKVPRLDLPRFGGILTLFPESVFISSLSAVEQPVSCLTFSDIFVCQILCANLSAYMVLSFWISFITG